MGTHGIMCELLGYLNLLYMYFVEYFWIRLQTPRIMNFSTLNVVCLMFTDINECLVDNGGCSHGCVNTAGSHYCTCPRYLYLSDDNSTCTGKDR